MVALARSGRALEVNSSRAMGPPRGPCPGPLPLRWWHEAGGEAISFGSDAHRPEDLAAGLSDAAAVAEAAGFRPGDDPVELWLRA
jgi:histidinol-phosphatase (PHP family)